MIEDFRPAFDAAPSAALKGGKPLVYVCPPAGWMIAPWYERVLDGMNEGSLILALAPDTGSVLDVQRALGPRFPEHPIHAVTGLARAGRLLKKESVRTLVATAEDALYLFQRSALKPETIEHLALLWPELMTDSAKECVDSILADVQKAKRFIATQSPTSVQELLERIAHRAPVMDAVPASETPVDQVRYAVVDESRRIEAARAALDIMDPETTLIWHPHPSDSWRALAGQADVELHEDASLESYSLAVAAELPTAEILRGLADAASQVLVFVRPDQISWLTTAAGTLKPLPLPGGADLVRSEAQATREILRRVLETEPPASQ
ncbi:MAG: hypothetical protein OEZ54_12145, partial [Gemmatimonadota bacterium]|nr:hypothetical protein [Gemmatimonadota bacterium]